MDVAAVFGVAGANSSVVKDVAGVVGNAANRKSIFKGRIHFH